MMHWWNLSKQQNIWMMYPPGDKEIIDFTLCDMEILSTEEEVEEEVEEDVNGFRERQMDRPNGGFGRGYFQGNNTRAQQQAPTDRPQPARQEDEWSLPTNVERRDDNREASDITSASTCCPPPTEERLFTDWSSSEDSPRERVRQ